jgi:hypothetical protein
MGTEHPKGNIFKCRVFRFVSGKGIPFVRLFRNMYYVPEHITELKKLVVGFQVIDTGESIALIFNRKFEKKNGSTFKIFKFNGVNCIKLGDYFWDKYGGVKDDLYVSVCDDKSLVISDDINKVSGATVIQVFGGSSNCLLPLNRLNVDPEIDEFSGSFSDGVYKFVPAKYPGELVLAVHGNGIFIPVDDFYDELKKEVDGDKILLSILVNDKDRRVEFMK